MLSDSKSDDIPPRNDFEYCFTRSNRDFPTFLMSYGQGPVEFGEKKHLDYQIRKTRTGPPFYMD